MNKISDKVLVLYPGEQLPATVAGAVKIYLAGTIDFGNENNNWQGKFEAGLAALCDPTKGLLSIKDTDFVIFDPRMPMMSGLAPNLDNPEFVNIIQWRLGCMDMADFVFCNIMNKSKSSIPILEFGALCPSTKLIVRCGDQNPMYPHVRLYCEKYSVPLLTGKTSVKDVILCAGTFIKKFQELKELGIPE